MKTCKDCKFISKVGEVFNEKEKTYIKKAEHDCDFNDCALTNFKKCKNFKQRTTGENDVFDWENLLVGLIVGLIGGLIGGLTSGSILGLIFGLIFGLFTGLIFGLIFGLINGLIVGFTDKKQIYKDSNIKEDERWLNNSCQEIKELEYGV